MRANVLLNLINELRMKRYRFNNTRVRMLDSIYHMTLKLLKNSIFGLRMADLTIFYATLNARLISYVNDFNNRNLFLTAKLMKQGYRYERYFIC